MRLYSLVFVLLLLAACSSGEKQSENQEAVSTEDNLVATSPDQALSIYIDGVREGDLETVKSVLHPPDINFQLGGKTPILSYEITERTMLTEKEASDYQFRPPPKAGDVHLVVRSKVRDSDDWVHSYWLREYESGWKIYSLSRHGLDT